nr:uncharacterized protein LOC106831827 isoform X2 [Equus asinus]
MYSEHSCMDDSHHIFSVYLVEINYPLLGPSSGWNPARGKVWRSPCQDGMRREEENRRQFERGPPPQQLKVSVSWICIAGLIEICGFQSRVCNPKDRRLKAFRHHLLRSS